eukprot:647166-Amorphochlora_amoeboformis.AAC.2
MEVQREVLTLVEVGGPCEQCFSAWIVEKVWGDHRRSRDMVSGVSRGVDPMACVQRLVSTIRWSVCGRNIIYKHTKNGEL